MRGRLSSRPAAENNSCIMPHSDQVVDLTKASHLSWLEKGCLATQIMGVTQERVGSAICAVVEIDNSEQSVAGAATVRLELLPTAYLRSKCPQLLIQFYEQKIDNITF